METREIAKVKIVSYRDLIVWQKAMDLVIIVYRLTNKYPASELYGLTSQTRRAVFSIPANIAEGRSRGSQKEFHRFMNIAYGSGAELETALEVGKRLSFGNDDDYKVAGNLLLEIMKMLNKMLQSG